MSTIPGESSWTDAGLLPPASTATPLVDEPGADHPDVRPQASRPDLRNEAAERDVLDQALDADADDKDDRDP